MLSALHLHFGCCLQCFRLCIFIWDDFYNGFSSSSLFELLLAYLSALHLHFGCHLGLLFTMGSAHRLHLGCYLQCRQLFTLHLGHYLERILVFIFTWAAIFDVFSSSSSLRCQLQCVVVVILVWAAIYNGFNSASSFGLLFTKLKLS